MSLIHPLCELIVTFRPKMTKFHFRQSQSEIRQKYKVQSVISIPHVLRRSQAHGEHLPRYKTQHVPPQEVCPFSAQQSFGCATSFSGFNNRLDRKSQSPVATVYHLQKINSPTIFSPREKFLTGLMTCLFNIPRA
jgi:hypothetical protein